jgi:murein DD-endopeptidase MepM/ murein hydrolase activator NlpD
MDRINLGRSRKLVALPVILAIAGCTGSQSADRAAVEIKGSSPGAAPQQAAAPAQPGGFGGTSPEGIVNYDSYQAAVARSGDTVTTVANRIGLSASELGAYNGLSPDHPLRPGDELVLPPRPGGYGTTPAPQPSTTFVPQGNTTGNTAIVATPLDGSGTAAAAQAPADTWSPDVAAAAINRANTFDSNRNLAAPPSANEPLPPAPTEPGTLQPPQLGQYQTPGEAPGPTPAARPVETLSTPQEQVAEPQVALAPPAETSIASSGAAPALRLIPPVRGTIVIGFQRGAGRARNDGIDYAAPANSPVVASASGEVALVSQSLGGLGTIVLVRHPGDYLTVYGRIEGVNVAKGDLVRQGQQIGMVAATTEPRMHFEVRKGAESLDPESFF